MKLRTKLFLAIGALLVLLSLIMYFLPYFLVEEDVGRAAADLKEIIRSEENEMAETQKDFLERQLDEIEANIDSLLYLISDSSKVSNSLKLQSASAPSSNAQIWQIISKFLAYDPAIGLLQWTNLKTGHSFTMLSNQASLHHFDAWLLTNHCYLIAVDRDHFFIGIDMGIGSTGKSLLLFSIEDFWNYKNDPGKGAPLGLELAQARKDLEQKWDLSSASSLQELEKQLSAIKKDGEALQSQEMQRSSSGDIRKGSDWASRVKMIEALAHYFGESQENQSHPQPAGIAQVDIFGRSLAVLAMDVFRKVPIFNDIEYFSKHSPQGDSIYNSISRAILIPDPVSHQYYLANSMMFGGPDQKMIITIGTDLNGFVRNLALSSDRYGILMIDEQAAIGFTDEGKQLPEELLKVFTEQLKQPGFDSNRFFFTGKSFHLFSISLAPKWPLAIYLLTPQKKQRLLEATFVKLNQAVSARISYNILFVALGSLVLALLILSRIAHNVTEPIAKLAHATEQVANGKYDEIELPEVKSRHDEVAILTQSFRDMIHGLRERERIRAVLNKVVSKDVATEILKTPVHLGGEDRIITMLFSDIRGFSKLTENLPPQLIIQMINAYMTQMSRIIEGEGGCIDKYVGDEIMALYGAPVAKPDHAVRAISSAILMVEYLKKWNRERAQSRLPPIEMGIGIHTGLVVAGNMGAEDRLNYTVLGSSVNLASRLCGVAKPMQILVSESTVLEENVRESFKYESLLPLVVKGFSEPIKVYQINGFEWI